MEDFTIWAAGFFDGEGSVTIIKSAYGLQISVTNNYKTIIEEFARRFDGSIATTSRANRKNKTYQFFFSFKAAREFLTQVLPYLRVKRADAELALDYISKITELASLRGGCRAGVKMTGIEYQARKEFRLRLKAIRQGSPPFTPTPLPSTPQGKLFKS